MPRSNRRLSHDRRLAKMNVSFPLQTNNNAVVSHNRRVRCERRLQGLELTESNISEKVFMDYFNALLDERADTNSVQDNQDSDAYKSHLKYN